MADFPPDLLRAVEKEVEEFFIGALTTMPQIQKAFPQEIKTADGRRFAVLFAGVDADDPSRVKLHVREINPMISMSALLRYEEPDGPYELPGVELVDRSDPWEQ